MPLVLVQLAGLRRNRARSPLPPAIQLARATFDGRRLHEVEIVADPSIDNLDLAKELAEKITSRRGRPHARVRAAENLVDPDLAHLRSRARDAMSPVVEQVLERHAGHLEDLGILVSIETGTAAQQVALAEGFARRGVEVKLVLLEPGGPRTLMAAPRVPSATYLASTTDPDAMLPHLAHLPPGRTVLLTGPTGSGKSRFARRLHEAWSAQAAGPFVHTNCAAIPAALLESELFGHEKGAFTGANAVKKGALEEAHDGTAFLDEIGELPLALQGKLLTALDHEDGIRSFRRVGGTEERQSNARLVFATNRNLDEMVGGRLFRDDLLARISAWEVRLPSLKERPFAALGSYLHALEELGSLVGGAVITLERPAWHELVRFTFAPTSVWRWNHRDVLHSAERLVMRCWGKAGYAESPSGKLCIEHDMMRLELKELSSRWQTDEARDTASPADWSDIAGELRPGGVVELSELERWEARILLRAKQATDSKADAWRWLVERRLLKQPRGRAVNPSAAFGKRWGKFPWR